MERREDNLKEEKEREREEEEEGNLAVALGLPALEYRDCLLRVVLFPCGNFHPFFASAHARIYFTILDA